MRDIGRSAKAGAAIFFAVLALAGGVALARGPEIFLPRAAEPSPDFWSQSFGSGRSQFDVDEPRPAHKRHAPRAQSASVGGKVCVRLCDGFFFPTTTTAGGDAACAAQCPDAPVALYSMPTDRIADAVSLDGARYSALPVANRHETTFDATCTCRHDPGASRIAELLRDPTLRRGDLVMTAEGFKVFEGHDAGDARPSDFVTLARATNVPRDKRAALVAMEHSSEGRPDRLKGSVTVDDGAHPSGH